MIQSSAPEVTALAAVKTKLAKYDFASWRAETKWFLLFGIALMLYVLYNWQLLRDLLLKKASVFNLAREQWGWHLPSDLWTLGLTLVVVLLTCNILDGNVTRSRWYWPKWICLCLMGDKQVATTRQRESNAERPIETEDKRSSGTVAASSIRFEKSSNPDITDDDDFKRNAKVKLTPLDFYNPNHNHITVDYKAIKDVSSTLTTSSEDKHTGFYSDVLLTSNLDNRVGHSYEAGSRKIEDIPSMEKDGVQKLYLSVSTHAREERMGTRQIGDSGNPVCVFKERNDMVAVPFCVSDTRVPNETNSDDAKKLINNGDTKSVPIPIRARTWRSEESQTEELATEDQHLPLMKPASTMTVAYTTDTCTGTHDMPYRLVRHCGTTTTGPFMKKVRRARRLLAATKATTQAEQASFVCKRRRILSKYKSKLESLAQLLSKKDEMLGGTSSRLVAVYGEIKEAMLAVRSIKERLNTQCKLNAALMDVIESKSDNPAYSAGLTEDGTCLSHEQRGTR